MYSWAGMGQGAAAVAGTGAKAVLKHIGKAVVRDVALGALTDASVETARQLVTGTKITNLEYDRIAEAGVYGGIAGGASSLAGAGLESFMQTRVAQKAIVKLNEMANKGADAIQNAFRKVTKKSGTTVGLEEPKFKMNLQSFAGDEVYQTSYGKSSGNLEKVINVMKEGEMSSNGRRITYQLDDSTRIVFGLDLGENAHPLRNHGYMTPVNHMNVEIQTIAESGNVYTKWDMHMLLDDDNNVTKTLITGPWKDR